uniref:Uncharacterized protein n=1 Tax=Rhizophora mucronata TaxID=61149 RepID=A0A2P2KN56_RHIMU
MNRQFIDSVKR